MRGVPRSTFTTRVVGLSFVNDYPRNVWEIEDRFQGAQACPPAELLRRPDNPHDSNAIEVHVPALGEGRTKIGHLPADVAARMAPAMDDGTSFDAEIEAVLRKPGSPHPGVAVRIIPPTAADQSIRPYGRMVAR